MTRLRNEVAGGIYHVTARGVDRRRIFVDDHDYELYTRLLGAVTERQGWLLLCYCLMPNHIHLLVETPDTNLGNGMQWLHSRYAIAFNIRHARKGHLFETRFNSPLVTSEAGVVRTAGYIVANPLAAALCHRAGDWAWSSHAHLGREDPAPDWLAHARLEEWLGEANRFDSYNELVTACEHLCAEKVPVVSSALLPARAQLRA